MSNHDSYSDWYFVLSVQQMRQKQAGLKAATKSISRPWLVHC